MLLLQISNFYKIAACCLLLAFCFCFVSPAYALTISPARIEIKGDPGATVGGEVTLINEQSTAQTFYASYENFGAQGETGAPAFSPEKNDLDTWLAVTPAQLTIASGQAVTVPYTISIPKDATPGGYFAAIFWSTSPPITNTNQVSIGAKIGLLVLLSVNGNVAESAGITQFTRAGHGFFYNALPVNLLYKFHNTGGDRVEPVGTVTFRDTFFIKSAQIDGNPAKGNILPNSIRQFDLQWLKQAAPYPVQGFFNHVQYQWQNFALGLYSARLNLAYGTQGLHATKTLWFLVVPWQLLLCIIIVISTIWWGGKKVIRRYNRYIIRQAQAGMNNSDVEHS